MYIEQIRDCLSVDRDLKHERSNLRCARHSLAKEMSAEYQRSHVYISKISEIACLSTEISHMSEAISDIPNTLSRKRCLRNFRDRFSLEENPLVSFIGFFCKRDLCLRIVSFEREAISDIVDTST